MPGTFGETPIFRPLDANGAIMPGFKLYAYIAGTTTHQPIYADQALTTPLAQPAVGNSSGALTFWLAQGQSYKLNLTDSADVQQSGWPVDNIVVLDEDQFTAIGSTQPITPEQYGAVGDGVANDTTPVQTAITAAAAANKVCKFTKTYKITSPIGFTSATHGQLVHLEGYGTLDCRTMADGNTALTLTGTLSTSAALGANATEGALTITCSLTVAAGDVLRILSTDSFSPASAAFVKGELVEVQSSAAGIITLKSHLRDNYTAATTTVAKILMPKVVVDNIRLLRDGNTSAGITVTFAQDITIQKCRVSGARDRGIFVNECYGGQVSDNHVDDAWASGGGTNYSFVLGSSQNITVSGNRFLDGRHGISNGGTYPFRSIKYIGNTVDNRHGIPNYAFDCHANGQDIVIQGNNIHNGMAVECLDTVIQGNTILCDDYSFGILLNNYGNSRTTRYLIVEGNSVVNLASGGNALTFTTSLATGVVIESLHIANNYLESDSSALRMTTSGAAAVFQNVNIVGNTIQNATFFSLAVIDGGPTITGDFQISGNYCRAARGVQIEHAGSLVFTGNHVFGTTAGLFLFESVSQTHVVCNGNFFNGDSDSAGIKFNNGNAVVYANNYIANVNSTPLTTAAGVAILQETDNIYVNTSGSISINAATEHRNLWIRDGLVAPPSRTGEVYIYVDTADGDLKVKFGDGTTKTIVVDT